MNETIIFLINLAITDILIILIMIFFQNPITWVVGIISLIFNHIVVFAFLIDMKDIKALIAEWDRS